MPSYPHAVSSRGGHSAFQFLKSVFYYRKMAFVKLVNSWRLIVEGAVFNVGKVYRKTPLLFPQSTPSPLLNMLSLDYMNSFYGFFRQAFGPNTQAILVVFNLLSLPFSPLSPAPTNTNKLIKV
jgi:hypothetical protein